MKKMISGICALAVSAALLHGQVDIGKPAPPFKSHDINGKFHALSDYKGKIVVLEAYNLDCPFCAHHFKTGAMQELQEEVTRQGGIWLVINSSHAKSSSYRSPEQARQEYKAQKMKATAWLDDSSGRIGQAYGLKTTPHMVVIDAEGKVAYNGAIDNHAATSGNPRESRNYVREAFQSLKAGKPVQVSRTRPYGCGIKYGS
jgi:peroxiredoxin